MSDSSVGFAGTLTGGIQDISALLPLLGTEQCERHTGSALDGGYIYAAATPLSLFGSLGIVKTGMSVLISSISLPKPSFSFKRTRVCWLGARVLHNAGFSLAGTVAPLIGMNEESHDGRIKPMVFASDLTRVDGKRYKTEDRLLEILEEKQMDDPEKVFVDWRSFKWNIGLVACTTAAAWLSLIPYIHLILRDLPNSPTIRWVFPIMRALGSSVGVVCCQFIIQHRLILLMKKRLIFMTLHRKLTRHSKNRESKLWGERHFKWNPELPAEECLWSLDQYLSYEYDLSRRDAEMQSPPGTQLDKDSFYSADEAGSTQSVLFLDPQRVLHMMREQHQRHFPSPKRQRIFMLVSWMLLFLSLPSAVAGYIGCFTLVTSSTSVSGTLVWLASEAALSILRTLLWAANPAFDEGTEVSIGLKLSKHPPLVTTDIDAEVLSADGGVLDLITERAFLERITPYTGPIGRFPCPQNTVLYFTMSGTPVVNSEENGEKRLFMTHYDLSRRSAFTLLWDGKQLLYWDAEVVCNIGTDQMQAKLKSSIEKGHRRRSNQPDLFESLESYYGFLLRVLCEPPSSAVTKLVWRWTLSQNVPVGRNAGPRKTIVAPPLSSFDRLYLERGYEHRLKNGLVADWSKWAAAGIDAMRTTTQCDRYSYLDDGTDDAAWRLSGLDRRLAVECTRREVMLVMLSHQLEKILESRMYDFIVAVEKEHDDERLKGWILDEFDLNREKRVQREKGEAKKRLNDAKAAEAQLAQTDARRFESRRWDDSPGFIEMPVEELEEWFNNVTDDWEADRRSASRNDSFQTFSLASIPGYWMLLLNLVRRRAEEMVSGLREAKFGDLTVMYKCPADSLEAIAPFHTRFVAPQIWKGLSREEKWLIWEHDFIAVQDIRGFNPEEVAAVMRNFKIRSLINADQVPMEDNDHLLYLSVAGRGISLPFIQRNRILWWMNAMARNANSSEVYFSPNGIDRQDAYRRDGAIAHILLFVQTRSRLRLRLVHSRVQSASISIQEHFKELRSIEAGEISEDKIGFLDVELDYFEPGNHELSLVVGNNNRYNLRDVRVAFIEDAPFTSPLVDTTHGDRIDLGDIVRIEEVFITLPQPHPDLPGKYQVGAHIIVNHEVVCETSFMEHRDGQTCWCLTIGHELLCNVGTFTFAILRKDHNDVARLLGTVDIARENIQGMHMKTEPVALEKVNTAGPELYLAMAYSRYRGIGASEDANLSPVNASLDPQLERIQRDLLPMYMPPMLQMPPKWHEISRMYERILLIPPRHKVRALLLTILGDVCTRNGPATDVGILHWAESIYHDAIRDAESIGYFEPLFWENAGSCLLQRFEKTGYTRDMKQSIQLLDQAVTRTAEWYPGKTSLVSKLTTSLASHSCFERNDRAGFAELLEFMNHDAARLFLAAWDANEDTIRDLANKHTIYGGTILLIAARKGHQKIVRQLLRRKDINVNLSTQDCETVLTIALRSRQDGIAEYLCKYRNPDVRHRASDGETALTLAIRNGNEHIIGQLCKQDYLDVNHRTSDNETPLSLAVRNGNIRIVKKLLEREDLDVNIRTADGETVFTLAKRGGNESIVQLLAEKHTSNIGNVDGDHGTTATNIHDGLLQL